MLNMARCAAAHGQPSIRRCDSVSAPQVENALPWHTYGTHGVTPGHSFETRQRRMSPQAVLQLNRRRTVDTQQWRPALQSAVSSQKNGTPVWHWPSIVWQVGGDGLASGSMQQNGCGSVSSSPG